MNLTLTKPSTFSQIAQSGLVTGDTLTAANMQGINENAKFAAVRTEEFYGFYSNGTTVELPVSPADGYEYSRDELTYWASLYWSGGTTYGPWNSGGGNRGSGPAVVVLGAIAPPYRGATSAGGEILSLGYGVDYSSGLVFGAVSYIKDGVSGGVMVNTPVATTDCILFVVVCAKRQR
jgi:hypothetical protein